jgi:hypothetical protein
MIPSNRILVLAVVTLTALAACGDGGGGGPLLPPGGVVNLLNTWNVTFTPDQCTSDIHDGLATFPSNNGDVTMIGNSRIEMQTWGCPGNFFSDITATLTAAGYPSTVTETLFLEILTERFSQNGDYSIRVFSTSEITFHRDVSAIDPTSVNNGVFQLTR